MLVTPVVDLQYGILHAHVPDTRLQGIVEYGT